MKFEKEWLKDLVWGDIPKEEATVVEKELVDTSRWSNIYEIVFKVEDKFYSSSYSVGATEMQDEQPYEYDDDEIECCEVVPVEKTIIVYEAVKDD